MRLLPGRRSLRTMIRSPAVMAARRSILWNWGSRPTARMGQVSRILRAFPSFQTRMPTARSRRRSAASSTGSGFWGSSLPGACWTASGPVPSRQTPAFSRKKGIQPDRLRPLFYPVYSRTSTAAHLALPCRWRADQERRVRPCPGTFTRHSRIAPAISPSCPARADHPDG